ncbi:MAG: glycosyltransferase [Magnetococcales bacterium]|nr:glycosyltransferase [Magnetococcales bacterium]
MKILMGFRRPFVALEEALIEQGVTLIPWRPGARLPEAVEEVDGALLDFTEAARHLIACFRLSRRLRARGIPVAALNRDAPWNKGVRTRRIWLLRKLQLLDFYLTHSLQERVTMAKRAVYFPNAADVSRYNLKGCSLEELRDINRYRHTVSFIGNIDDRRYPEHRERMTRLHALSDMLATHGIELKLFHGMDLSVDEQVEIMRASIINLNLGAACDHGGAMSWGLPERCYGIPACGGFLLSDRRRHAEVDFTPGEDWLDFESLEACVALIRELLEAFPRTRSIAEAAHVRVMEQHTYAQRAQTLVGLLTWARRGAQET